MLTQFQQNSQIRKSGLIMQKIFLLVISQLFGFLGLCETTVINATLPPLPPIECQDPESDLCVMAGYDPFLLPKLFTEVFVQFQYMEIEEVNDISTNIRVSCTAMLNWADERVRLKPYASEPEMEVKMIPHFDYDKFFAPILVLYSKEFFLRVDMQRYFDYRMVTIFRLNMVMLVGGSFDVDCAMDFSRFPFDKQTCLFFLGHFSLIKDDVPMTLLGMDYDKSQQKPLQYTITLEPAQHHYLGLRMFTTDGIEAPIDSHDGPVRYNRSLAGFWIHLERNSRSLVLQFILPSALFVVCSWISFIMPINGGERSGLLVTLLLVLVSLYLGAVNISPRSDTVNSLEIWIIGTISFVSLALVEYAIAMIAYNRPRAHALKRYRKMNNKRGLKSSEDNVKAASLGEQNAEEPTDKKGSLPIKIISGGTAKKVDPLPKRIDIATKEKELNRPLKLSEENSLDAIEWERFSKKIDSVSLFVMPIIFAFFSFAYWRICAVREYE